MRNKVINISLVALVLVVLAVFGRYVRMGACADAVVVLKTSGITCDRCVQQVTRALQSQRGVAAIEVDLKKGWVVAGYDSKQVAPGELAKKVCDSGFCSQVEKVLTPQQFKAVAGHEVSRQTGGCCGQRICSGKE
ncbi:heavy-metal-associated domain-containing protein [Geomonas sp. Red32]|uniref:heavy-metal-associated domain-containing protein n=1 Tax=Geomonas sp. Red32 TaxID=2912856 RepID=UPI00202D0902|nr:heavy-metal-associated domain-containing protein [Geomonas sp. Red32]MCM0079975.1 heavy-metal-associated domain-containing protein [Geomonas sp. Red32]